MSDEVRDDEARARLRELKAEVAAAAESDDAARLARLLREIATLKRRLEGETP